MKKLGLLLALILAFTFNAKSSHISGGDITFTSLGNNTYIITLSLFRDCDGITMSTTSSVTIESASCAESFTVSLPVVPNPLTGDNFTDISQLCAAQLPNSTCNGGTLPGMQLYVYQDTVTLPASCTDWTVSWYTCCRNTTVNVPTSTSDDVFIMATFDNLNYPNNSSPQFTGQPIPYVCNGQAYSMDFFGVTEPDGDSVSYQFIAAMENGGLPLVYGGGYSSGQPINGITIDPVTGIMNVTPNTNGNFIVTVAIIEYDANGNVMSTVMRDIQLVVLTCNNEPPVNDDPGGGITNFQSATGTSPDSSSIQICEGQNFCFDVTLSDPDAGDTVTLDTNGFSVIMPGWTYSKSGFNPATFTICWTPPAGSPAYVGLPLQFTDDNCPITSIPYNLVVDIDIYDAVVAGPDQIICNSQGAQLTASGGPTFTWSVITGDPITVGSNFSCNPCANPIATPAITTTYLVTGNLPAGCTQTDTVVVTVVPDYTFSLAQTGGVTCLADTIGLTTTINPPAGYTFAWTTTDGSFDNPNAQNPNYIPDAPGTYDLVVQITSPQGCVDYDTAQVVVNPGFTPDFDLFTQNDTIDCGDITDIEVNLNSSIPAFCQASPLTCGVTSDADVGAGNITGQNTGTNWPAPYGNWYRNARHQFLFTAAELNAMGFLGGKISEISWEAVLNNGATSTFNSYQIWIGCTPLTSLDAWEPTANLTQVFGPTNITVALGWNTHQFTQGYDWDGISNIIVEICYDNLSTSYTDNWSTPYTTTTFNSTCYYYSDSQVACGNATNYGPIMRRPVTRFGYCAGDPDPSNYTFSYNPGATNIIQPDSVEVDPCTTTTYTVTVTDNTTGCVDSAQITIVVDNPVCGPPDLLMDSVQCNAGTDGIIYAEGIGQDGPWTFEWTDAGGNILQTTNNADFDTLTNVAAGWYYCTTTDMNACSQTDSIYVGEPTALTMTVSADSTICIGDDVTVEVYPAGGSPGYTYNWNQGLANANSHVVTPTQDTCYVVTVTDDNGCVTAADSVCITLNPPLAAVLSPNDSICPGSSSTITAAASGGSGTGYNYSWVDSEGNTYSGTSFTVTPTAQITYYYLTLTDDCTTPAYLDTVSVLLQPYVASLSSTDATCGGYADGTATVVITGSTGPYTLDWIDLSDNSTVEQDLNVVNTADVTILSAGNYQLQIVDQGGCSVDTSFTINEPTPVTITMGSGSTICLTDAATVSATGGGGTAPYTLTWNNGLAGNGPHSVSPMVDTWYSVFATDANGCTSPTDSVLVQLNPPLSATALVDGSVCPGDDFNQIVTASGGSGTGYTYNWVGSDGSTYTGSNITVTPGTGSVTYTLTITDDCGTPAYTDNFTVTWYTLPQVNFTGTNLEGCAPITSQFNANVNNAATYNWIFGDGNTTGFGQNMAATNTYDSPGCFDVTLQVQTNDGCLVDTTYMQYVCAWDYPTASFIPSPQVTTTEETTVTFTNTSDGDSISFWNFGGLGTSNMENPVFTFPDSEEGMYPVTLVVVNDHGCTDSTMIIITVEQEVQFFIPNTFTPDGDEYNQTWQIHGYGFDPYSFSVTVYNRWGEVMWESRNSEVGWDGTYLGQLVPDGVYVWKITTKRLRDDSKVERYGHLTIIR
ncbi:MAG: PKD domain-containing protein [Crocinitomicaceae bacterium]